MTVYAVADRTQLLAALLSAQAGDSIKLGPANYGSLNLPSASTRYRVGAAGIVIEPADGVAKADVIFGSLTFNLWEGYTFKNIHCNGLVYFNQTKRMALVGCDIFGNPVEWETQAANVGVRIKTCEDTLVQGCAIKYWNEGITVAGEDSQSRYCRRTQIVENLIEFIRIDGIRGFSWTDDTEVRRNYLRNFANSGLAHLDVFQTFGNQILNLRFIENVYDCGTTGANRQFLFLDNVEDGYLIIRGNMAFGAGAHSITSVWRGAPNADTGIQAGIIEDNWIQGLNPWSPNINVNQGPNYPNVIVRNNVKAPMASSKDDRALFDAEYNARFNVETPPEEPEEPPPPDPDPEEPPPEEPEEPEEPPPEEPEEPPPEEEEPVGARPINEITGIKRRSSVLVRGMSHMELAKAIGAIPQGYTTEQYVEWARGPRGLSTFDLWKLEPENADKTLDDFMSELGLAEAAQARGFLTEVESYADLAQAAEFAARGYGLRAEKWAASLDGPVDGPNFSAKYYAQAAAASAEEAQDAADLIAGGVLTNTAIIGLETSRNVANPDTQIDISVGQCRSSDNSTDIVLAAPLTVDLTTVGVNGRDVATALALGQSWHLHVIKNPTTSEVRAVASLSPTAPTMPAGFTKRRYIFPIPRLGTGVWTGNTPSDGTKIPPYVQIGGLVELSKPNNEFSGQTGNTAAQLKDLMLPLGIKLIAQLFGQMVGDGSTMLLKVRSPDHGVPTAFGGTDQFAFLRPSSGQTYPTAVFEVPTNTTAQVYVMASSAAGTWALKTLGYRFRRDVP